MGNNSGLQSTTGSATSVPQKKSLKEHIREFKKSRDTNSYTVLEADTKLEKIVPRIAGIEQSSILRRRVLSRRICKTYSEGSALHEACKRPGWLPRDLKDQSAGLDLAVPGRPVRTLLDSLHPEVASPDLDNSFILIEDLQTYKRVNF